MAVLSVAVVVAGYAGVSAARALVRAGHDVIVLEASNQIGGRVRTEHLVDGTPIDVGGMWLGAGHDRFAELARNAGAATYATPSSGDALFVNGTTRRRYDPAALPPIGTVASRLLELVMWRIERIASTVDVDAPWRSPHADHLDSITVATWLRRAAPLSATRRLIEIVLREVLCADSSTVSMLALATYLKSAGGVAAMLSTAGGAQQELFVDGAIAPLRHAAAELDDRIHFGSPVTAVDQRLDAVVVRTTDDEYECDRVVVAIPPTLAGRIDYRPVLPAARDSLTQQSPMGAVWKIFAIYDEPFWRHNGLSGETIDLNSLISATFDVSPPGGPGVMCSLVGGSAARSLDTFEPDSRRRLVLDHFATLFGPPARRPDHYLETSWGAQPFARGGYSAVPPPGVLTTLGASMRTPIGRIHWAGTETSDCYQGYIEGAIRSGERAAVEIARTALHRNQPEPHPT